MNLKMNHFYGVLFLMLFFMQTSIYSQQFPAYIWVPVTFYDFHSDRSNPEFEQRHFSGVRTGMVQTTLGADSKPELGPIPYLNYGIKKWFMPWTPGDFNAPSYTPTAPLPLERFAGTEWPKEFQQEIVPTGMKQLSHDTSFKNIVIKDSLKFQHIGNGTYQFINETFFPLDDRGFGNEWNHERDNEPYNQQKGINSKHNYSFAMELHWRFAKKPGMQFTFSGDDDVWVFVNKKLQIDLGGIHNGTTERSFTVDNSLKDGVMYDLDIFYAERHSSGSHIRITTNIISTPSNIDLYGSRGDPKTITPLGTSVSIKEGQPFPIYGNIFDSTGNWKPEYNQYITWEISGNGSLSTTKGDSTTLLNPEGNTQVTIIAKFKNPDDPSAQESIKSITITIEPVIGPDYRVEIDTSKASKSNVGLTELVLDKSQDRVVLWGKVYDKKNNFTHYVSISAQWSSTQQGLVNVSPISGETTTLIKGDLAAAEQSMIILKDGNLIPDTLIVRFRGVKSHVVTPVPFIPGVTNIENYIGNKDSKLYQHYKNVIYSPNIVLIAIGTEGPLVLLNHSNSSYAKVRIYDAVGNLIRKDLSLIKAGNTLSYGIAWDGLNDRKRFVGAGTYLVDVRAKEKKRDGSIGDFTIRAKVAVGSR